MGEGKEGERRGRWGKEGMSGWGSRVSVCGGVRFFQSFHSLKYFSSSFQFSSPFISKPSLFFHFPSYSFSAFTHSYLFLLSFHLTLLIILFFSNPFLSLQMPFLSILPLSLLILSLLIQSFHFSLSLFLSIFSFLPLHFPTPPPPLPVCYPPYTHT